MYVKLPPSLSSVRSPPSQAPLLLPSPPPYRHLPSLPCCTCSCSPMAPVLLGAPPLLPPFLLPPPPNLFLAARAPPLPQPLFSLAPLLSCLPPSHCTRSRFPMAPLLPGAPPLPYVPFLLSVQGKQKTYVREHVLMYSPGCVHHKRSSLPFLSLWDHAVAGRVPVVLVFFVADHHLWISHIVGHV